jgi:hypothetical protein
MTIRIGTGLLLVLALISRPLFAEQMIVDKQIRLSPGHPVEPYRIIRTSNGDLIVFGAASSLNLAPWAIRLSPTGEVRWEFLEGGWNAPRDRRASGSRFYDAVELADKTTLLCGIKVVDKVNLVLLDVLRPDGSLISERLLRPQRERTYVSGATCFQWNQGIALIGGVFGGPAGTGWLAMLDEQLNIKSERFGDEYGTMHVLVSTGGAFFMLNTALRNPDGGSTSVIKIGPSGDIVARHVFSDSDNPELVRPTMPRSDLRVALLQDTLKTEIVDLDEQLHPTRTIKLHNAGVKQCVALPDGSMAIFGSQFHDIASAAVTRVYKDGSSKAFPVEPAIGSPWYIDAVLTGNPAQFAAVRIANYNEAVLDWVSFK